MLFRLCGEVAVGLLVAGLVTAVLVPVAIQLGYTTGPWIAWVAAAGSIAVCVAVGERRHKRHRARQSP